MPREPFQYPDWCDGPVVDLDISDGFPICTGFIFDEPTMGYATPCIPPDIGPPQFCPCIPTITMSDESLMDVGHTAVGGFDIRIIPNTQDCCDPDFRLTFDLDVPCMPFELTAVVTSPPGVVIPSAHFTKYPGTCKFKFRMDLPPGGGRGLEVELWQHGPGVKFIDCCSGTGIIDMDASMFITPSGYAKLQLFHHVNLQIPLIGKLVDYVTSECADLESDMTDPWGVACVWSAAGDRPMVKKYVKKTT